MVVDRFLDVLEMSPTKICYRKKINSLLCTLETINGRTNGRLELDYLLSLFSWKLELGQDCNNIPSNELGVGRKASAN